MSQCRSLHESFGVYLAVDWNGRELTEIFFNQVLWDMLEIYLCQFDEKRLQKSKMHCYISCELIYNVHQNRLSFPL